MRQDEAGGAPGSLKKLLLSRRLVPRGLLLPPIRKLTAAAEASSSEASSLSASDLRLLPSELLLLLLQARLLPDQELDVATLD